MFHIRNRESPPLFGQLRQPRTPLLVQVSLGYSLVRAVMLGTNLQEEKRMNGSVGHRGTDKYGTARESNCSVQHVQLETLTTCGLLTCRNRASNSPLNSQAPGPQLLILKRPNAPKSDQPRSGSATPKTLTQREEEYRLARERIFGAEDESRSEGKDSKDGKVEAEGKKEQRGSREGRDRNQKGTRRSGTSTPTSHSNPRSGRSSPRMRADDLAREVDRLALGHGGQGQYSQPPQQYTQPPQQYSQQPPHQYSQQPPQHYSQPPQQYSQYPQYGLPQPSPYHQPQPRPPQRYQQIYQPDYGNGPQQAPSPRGSPAGPVPVLRGGNSPGIIRQPRGPQGSGFSNGR